MLNETIFIVGEREGERFAITGLKQFHKIHDEEYSSFRVEFDVVIDPHKFANKNLTRKPKEVERALSGEHRYIMHVMVFKDVIEGAIIYSVDKDEKIRKFHSICREKTEGYEEDLKYIKSVIDNWMDVNAGIYPIQDVLNGYSVFTYAGGGLMHRVERVVRLDVVNKFETDLDACMHASRKRRCVYNLHRWRRVSEHQGKHESGF